jgi:hypothetical protein
VLPLLTLALPVGVIESTLLACPEMPKVMVGEPAANVVAPRVVNATEFCAPLLPEILMFGEASPTRKIGSAAEPVSLELLLLSSTKTIQPLAHVAVLSQLDAFVLVQTTIRFPRLNASERAIRIAANVVLADVVNRWLSISELRLGAAMPATIAIIANVTISSTNVKPACLIFMLYEFSQGFAMI